MLGDAGQVPSGMSVESACGPVTTAGGSQLVYGHTLSNTELPPVQGLVGHMTQVGTKVCISDITTQ